MTGAARNTSSGPPVLRQILNLWTLVGHPRPNREWSLEKKLEAVRAEGFDGFMERLEPVHGKVADRLGLLRIGFFRSFKAREFGPLLRAQRDAGAQRVNVHLGEHDTPHDDALRLACSLMEEAGGAGISASIETHRDTCTETPEKTFALAKDFHRQTGRVLPLTWDFSHFAVVKHLLPPFAPRLCAQRDLIQAAEQFHFRPFNGHHCQVPVTNGASRLTPEFKDFTPLVRSAMRIWLEASAVGREMFVVPEMGPVWLGYNLHSFPGSWDQARRLRREIGKIWKQELNSRNENQKTRVSNSTKHQI